MKQAKIAELAKVSQADVSRYISGKAMSSAAKTEAIFLVLNKSKAGMVLNYLSMAGRTITMQESLSWFGLASLSQTVTRLRKQGHDIRNIGPGGPHDYGVYALYVNGVRV